MVLLPEASEHLLGTPWAPSPRRKLMPPPVPGELNDGTACAGPRIRVPDCALCPGPRIPDRLWRRVPWAVIGGGAHATSHAKNPNLYSDFGLRAIPDGQIGSLQLIRTLSFRVL